MKSIFSYLNNKKLLNHQISSEHNEKTNRVIDSFCDEWVIKIVYEDIDDDYLFYENKDMALAEADKIKKLIENNAIDPEIKDIVISKRSELKEGV